MQGLKPSHYVTDFLLDKLSLIKRNKPITKQMLGFGELPFNLTYWDAPKEEDDIDDQIKLPTGNFMIRFFDQLSFDSIHFFLGVGGQPVT